MTLLSCSQYVLFGALILLCLEGLALGFTNGDLRLSGIGSSRLAGRLEIFHNSQWGTVCGGGPEDGTGFNFGPRAAQIACRQMGLGFAVDFFSASHLPEQRYQFGHGNGSIFLSEVDCQEHHTHILQCTFGLIGSEYSTTCDHSMDVSVLCSDINSPYNGEIRLSPFPSSPSPLPPSAGILELHANGQWKGVCLDGVTASTADTLCKQLGYSELDRFESIPNSLSTDVWDLTLPTSCNGGTCISSCLNNQLPTTTRSPCPTTLLRCGFNSNTAEFDDLPDLLSACSVQPTPIPEKFIQLVSNTDAAVTARVDVFVAGEWGTFCRIGFSLKEADVVCKQAGHSAALRFSDVTLASNRDVSRGTGDAYSLSCTGLETNVSACSITIATSEQCNTHNHDVTVQCSNVIAPFGSIALRGPSGQVGGSSGTLVVFNGDHFRPVCDAGFGSLEANTVCRQLGYSSNVSRAIPNSLFGGISASPNTDPRMVRLTGPCSGSESSILACGYTEAVGSECMANFDEVAVECFSETPNIDFLLVSESGEEDGEEDEAETRSGHLRIQLNGSTGRVCGEEFGWNEGFVVCKYLGFQSLLSIQRRDQVPQTSSLPVHLRYINCYGIERNPLHCNVSLSGTSECPAEDLDIWMECGTAPLETDGDLRLVGGETTPTSLSGRLEVSQNKKWLGVCGNFFSMEAAQVACRQLGYSEATDYCTDACFGEGDGEVFLADHRCSGDESVFLDCPTERYHPRACNHSTIVGLFCDGLVLTDPVTPESPASSPTTLRVSAPKTRMPVYIYFIIGGAGVIVAIVVAIVCCICCCHRRRNKASISQRNQSNQNGHSYHNGVVGDLNALAKEKEGGFDDIREVLEPTESSASNLNSYSHMESARHDAIQLALNSSHEEEGRYVTMKTKVKTTQASADNHHVHYVGNRSSSDVMVHRGHLSSTSDLAPPPDYDELFCTNSTSSSIQQTSSSHTCNWCDGEDEKEMV